MRPCSRSGRLGSLGPGPRSSGARGPNDAAHSGRGAAAWGWWWRPLVAIRSAAPWAALGAGLARRRRGVSLGQGSALSGCGPEAGTEGAGPRGPSGRRARRAGRAHGAAGEIPGRCSGVPGAQRPRGRASRRPAPRVGRYPSAAEPPPASAPADWRSRSPASHCRAPADSAPFLFSPPLGRAPRCLCSSGPAKERAPSSRGLPREDGDARERKVASAGLAGLPRAAGEERAPPRAPGMGCPARPPRPGPLPARPGPAAASCGLTAPPEGQNPGQVPPRSCWASAPPDGDLVPQAPGLGGPPSTLQRARASRSGGWGRLRREREELGI